MRKPAGYQPTGDQEITRGHIAMTFNSDSVAAFARLHGPDTSWEAAESVSAEATSALKRWILGHLATRVLADHELVYDLLVDAKRGVAPLVTPQRVRTARQDLVKAGLLAEANVTVRTPAGRKARTWMAAL